MDSKEDLVSIKDIFLVIDKLYLIFKKNRLLLLIAALFGLALGLTYTIIKKAKYDGQLSFFLNENQSSSSLNLNSLAGLAGISGVSNTSISEDKLVFLANSRLIVGTTLLQSAVVNGRTDLLANHFIEIYKLKGAFELDTALVGFEKFTTSHLGELDYKQNLALDIIIFMIQKGNLLKIEAKKKAGIVAQGAGIVVINFTTQNEELTKQFLDSLYRKLSEFYISKITQKHQKHFQIILARADSLKIVLSQKEIAGADYFDRNVNLAKMTGRVKLERSRRDIEVISLMYAEVLKNLEIAKFNLENETPSFQLIDSPTYPIKRDKPSKLLFSILGFFTAPFLLFWFLVIKAFIRKHRQVSR